MNSMRNFRLIAALSAMAVIPRPAPDLAINLGQGKQIKLAQYKGKTVVLAFILTYCSHCQMVVRALTKMQTELGPRGLQVLASATEDMAASALPAFLRQYAPPFPVGYNSNIESTAFLQHSSMLMLYMPGLIFIDKTGVIRAQYEGNDAFLQETSAEKNIRAKVQELMK